MGPQVDWALSALDAGSVQGIDFSGIEHLQGGEDDDRFILVDGAELSGGLDGASGNQDAFVFGQEGSLDGPGVLIEAVDSTDIQASIEANAVNNVTNFGYLSSAMDIRRDTSATLGDDSSNQVALDGLNGGDTGLVKVRALSQGGSSGGVFGNAGSLLFDSSNITAVGTFVYSEILGLIEACLDSCTVTVDESDGDLVVEACSSAAVLAPVIGSWARYVGVA